jgi:S1-C subfamily serine protease
MTKTKTNRSAVAATAERLIPSQSRRFYLAVFLLLLLAVVVARLPTAPEFAAMPSVVWIDAEVEVQVSLSPSSIIFGGSADRVDLAPVPAPATPPKVVTRHWGGTGFVVDGHLVTARHVVVSEEPTETVKKITVTTEQGATARVEVVREERESDLAELKTLDSFKMPSLRLAKTAPKRGDAVTQIGNPAGIRFVTSQGILVGFDRRQGYNIVAIDTYGGNSGGPDLNAAGEVIGVCHTLITGSRFTGIGTLAALRDFLNPDGIR